MGITNRTDGLFKHIRDLDGYCETLNTLTQLLPERTTISQAAFFLKAASDDLSGKDPTFTSVKDALGPGFGRSLHSTYRSLLTPSKAVPHGAGFLERFENPDDNRQKILRLTKKGRELLTNLIEQLNNDEAVN